MMHIIYRLRLELSDLKAKINRLEEFLEKETTNPTFTDEVQRIKMACQLEHMLGYAQVLDERIRYDLNKTK